MANELETARLQINSINAQLVKLLTQRFAAVATVNDYKVAHHLPVLDQQREQAILQRIGDQVTDPALAHSIQAIFREIMKQSRLYENEQRKGE